MIANIVKEINELLNNGQPYSALGMALALPDICGSVAYPDLSVGERYRQWLHVDDQLRLSSSLS